MAVSSDTNDVKIDRFNWFTEHPKYHEMLSWGFEDTGQLQTTLLVYLDLCEAKNWWKMEIHPCRSLRIAYLTGKPNKKDEYVTVLPVQTKAILSPATLHAFLTNIEPKHSKREKTQDSSSSTAASSKTKAAIPKEHEATRTLTLAITDSDSTIVYYRISDGLVSPDSAPSITAEEGEEGEDKGGKGKGRRRKGGKKKAGRGEGVS